jgi:hypothetical protein
LHNCNNKCKIVNKATTRAVIQEVKVEVEAEDVVIDRFRFSLPPPSRLNRKRGPVSTAIKSVIWQTRVHTDSKLQYQLQLRFNRKHGHATSATKSVT